MTAANHFETCSLCHTSAPCKHTVGRMLGDLQRLAMVKKESAEARAGGSDNMTKRSDETVVVECECVSCGGKGLCSGVAEDAHTAVVCSRCKGTGKASISYRPFVGRRPPGSIVWVYQTNPGIKVGGTRPARFGGMSIHAWETGRPFPPGSENRECTCPAWWYQSADYEKKPKWKECPWGTYFSDCSSFPEKHKCWDRWDRENPLASCEACKGDRWGVDASGVASPCPLCNHDGAAPAREETKP